MRLKLAGTLAALIMSAASLAHASPSSDALNMCNDELAKAWAERFPGLEYDFRSMRGGSAKKITYRVIWNGERGSADCCVRRGAFERIEWPESFLSIEASQTATPIAKDGAMETSISAEFPYTKKIVDVNGSRMAYVDAGEGPVVLFLHGNPTSSYLWRNILPYAQNNHRVIAPDLIGTGDSDKPDIGYTFVEHDAYLEAFIDALDLKNITLVVHDWGSGLGMYYARRHEDNARAIAFMEAIIPPALPAPSLEAMGEQSAEVFGNLRTPGVGENMVACPGRYRNCHLHPCCRMALL